MPRGSTEQARLRLPAPCRHCYRTSGHGSRLPKRASSSQPRTINTRLEKQTTTADEKSSRSRHGTGPSSTSCRPRNGSTSYRFDRCDEHCLERISVPAHLASAASECPLYPQKRTSLSAIAMSALCQKRTFRCFPYLILVPGPARHWRMTRRGFVHRK